MIDFTRASDRETLAEAFITRLNQTTDDPFTEHHLIVPSLSVRDWLSDRVARRNGIALLQKISLWGDFFHWQIARSSGKGHIARPSPLAYATMQWRLFAYLSANRFAPDSAVGQLLDHLLGKHRADDARRHQRLWQLAAQCARTFVRYMEMRADWLEQWGDEIPTTLEGWVQLNEPLPAWRAAHYTLVAAAQAELWRACFASIYADYQQRTHHFWQQLEAGNDALSRLPQHLMLFDFGLVSAQFVANLQRLGQYIDIDVYYHTPSLGYFGDMIDDYYLQKLHLRGMVDERQHRSSVHPLLSRWGKQQRDLFRLLEPIQDGSKTHIQTHDLDDPLPQVSVLGVLQQEIRALSPGLLAAYGRIDDSLRVNGCHGLMRQLEVLRGDIVAWLNADDSRTLADILIVLPDVAAAYGVISAVFPPDGRYDGYHLPARITGVTPPDAERLWSALLGWFDLIRGRFDAESVLAWLLNEDVCAMLDVSLEAMNRISEALVAAGFRRGFDAAHLAETLDPDDHDHRFSFCYALDRLVAGLFMPQAPLYRGQIVPQDGLMMSDAAAINALCRLANHWRKQRAQSVESAPLLAWLDQIAVCVGERFATKDNMSAVQTIASAVQSLREQIEALPQSAHEHLLPVPLRFVLDYLGDQLSGVSRRSEPSGVITIGNLTALRGLPYKLIAFVDADITRFPANPPEDRYDLMRIDQHRLGDHRVEQDDLAALLDVLMNAQETCWIYYSQHSAHGQDTQMLAPPIAELLQYCRDQLGEPAAVLHLSHRSDPFHADEHRAHPAPLWRDVRETLQHSLVHPIIQPFMPLRVVDQLPPLSEIGAQNLIWTHVISDVQRPATALARALDIRLGEGLPPLSTLEPLTLNNLQRYQLAQRFIEHPHDPALPHLPLLPAGVAAAITHQREHTAWRARRDQLLHAAAAPALTSCATHTHTFAALNISAVLPEALDSPQWLMMHPSKAKDKHLLRVWLNHLLWHVAGGRGESWCAFSDKLLRFSAVDDASALLTPWLQVWHYSQQKLWLLPVSVGCAATKPSEKGKAPNLSRIIRAWSEQEYPVDNREAFDLLTRGYRREQIEALIAQSAERYADLLYAPLWAHYDEVSS